MYKIDIARFLVQLIVLVALNARLFGVPPSEAYVPYLQPSGSPFTSVHGIYESLEIALSHNIIPFLAIGVLLLTALVAGKALCAWACPFGLIQDLAALVPVKRIVLPASTLREIRDIKWAAVGVSLLWSLYIAHKRFASAIFSIQYQVPDEYPVWQPSDSPFALVSPASTLFAYVPYIALWKPTVLLTGGIFGWLKLAIAVAAIVAAAFIPRFFCRYICPMGACLEPFTRVKVLRIARTPGMSQKDFNRVMDTACPMGVEQEEQKAVGDDDLFVTSPACIHCGRCVAESSAFRQKLVF